MVLHGVLHFLCGEYDCWGCFMTPSEFVLAQGFFWYAFGGCLLALLAYDFFHFLLDVLPEFFQVVFLWIISKWGKQS
jgi:hypothetical protein